jgi:hypothetical protein
MVIEMLRSNYEQNNNFTWLDFLLNEQRPSIKNSRKAKQKKKPHLNMAISEVIG